MATLGGYTLGARLGEGLDGVVYRAVGPSGGQVAIKSVRTTSAASAASVRREIAALRSLEHPGIIPIFDSGLWRAPAGGGETPWYAMELIPGSSWGEALAGAPEPTIIDAAAALCSALACLHGHGMIHGDIKPSNIRMRTPTDPVLIDFGMTRTVAERDDLQLNAVASGTAAYMSPEAVRGDLLDARADLWSLGVLLYVTLHGELPFKTVREILDAGGRRWRTNSSRFDALFARLFVPDAADRMGHAAEVMGRLVEMGAPPRDARTPTCLYRPSLHGRTQVLRDIGLQIAARLQAGRGGAWVLAGPSGIGKTRVASELGRGFSRNQIPVTAARARRPAHGDPEPFGVAIQWIDDLTERNAIPDLRRHGAVLGTIVPKLAQRYGPPPRLPPDAAHARLRKAVIQALTAATRDRPLLLALDDLQWLHRTSIEMLVDLCAEMDTFPVVLVATARTDVDLEALDALARAGASEVTLAPLPAHEIHAVIADMLGTERPPPTLADSLAAHTGGNPFFVAEALRAALAAGFLSQDDEGTWLCASATDLAGAGVPSSVRALLEGRVGALTAPQRQLAAAAAVLGHQFAETDLAQLCPDLYGAQAVNALLRAHVLLCPQPGVLVFEHDLIGEIALEALAISRRIELHTAAADLLEPRTQSNPSLWFVVAHHLQQAQLPQREAAARRASARTAIERSTLSLSDAREHLMRALELDPSSVSTQIELESVTRGNKAEN